MQIQLRGLAELLLCRHERLCAQAPVFQEFLQLAHGTSALKDENR